jgi:hypothetical protein
MFALIDEMAAAFDFKLLQEQNLDGHAVYVFSASPRPGYQPKSWETRILKGMKGTLWVDRNSYQWVKVEAVAIKPVSLGWFIAKVLPGTHFLLEQTPVTPGLWQPEHFSFEVHARILWWQKSIVHSETYSDYRRRLAVSSTSSQARRGQAVAVPSFLMPTGHLPRNGVDWTGILARRNEPGTEGIRVCLSETKRFQKFREALCKG